MFFCFVISTIYNINYIIRIGNRRFGNRDIGRNRISLCNVKRQIVILFILHHCIGFRAYINKIRNRHGIKSRHFRRSICFFDIISFNINRYNRSVTSLFAFIIFVFIIKHIFAFRCSVIGRLSFFIFRFLISIFFSICRFVLNKI